MMSSKPTAETRASSSFDTKPENARIVDVGARERAQLADERRSRRRRAA